MLGRGQQLPGDHHILRRVSWARLRRDADGEVIGCLPQAFELRENEQDLSANWLEYHDGVTHAARIGQCVVELRSASLRGGTKIGPKCGFAVACVRKAKEVCGGLRKQVRIVYAPSHIASHAVIKNLPRDDASLLDAFATEAFTEMVMNKDIPEV